MATRILSLLVSAAVLALVIGYSRMPSSRHHSIEAATWIAVQDFGGLMAALAAFLGMVLEGRGKTKQSRIVIGTLTTVALACIVAWVVKPAYNG